MKINDFSAELIEAKTEKPFKEHMDDNGACYVEVEPDTEYFVRVASEASYPVTADILIDGNDLGYEATFTNDSYLCGLWKKRKTDLVSTHKALTFKKTSFPPGFFKQEMPFDPDGGLWTGKVEITFYKAIQKGFEKKMKNDVEPKWSEGNVHMRNEMLHMMKGVKSSKGHHSVSKVEDCRIKWERGIKLQTITLTYCTAHGLILSGILAQPPHWEYQRLIKPYKKRKDEVIVEPEYGNRLVTSYDGSVYSSEKYEIFDLTKNDSSCSDDQSTKAKE